MAACWVAMNFRLSDGLVRDLPASRSLLECKKIRLKEMPPMVDRVRLGSIEDIAGLAIRQQLAMAVR